MIDDNQLIAVTQDYNKVMCDFKHTATENGKSSINFAIYCGDIKISAVFF